MRCAAPICAERASFAAASRGCALGSLQVPGKVMLDFLTRAAVDQRMPPTRGLLACPARARRTRPRGKQCPVSAGRE